MTKIKMMYAFLEKIAFGIWGVTVLDLLPAIDVGIFENVDKDMRTALAFVGFVYFLTQIFHKGIMQYRERQMKKEELLKFQKENGTYTGRKDTSFKYIVLILIVCIVCAIVILKMI